MTTPTSTFNVHLPGEPDHIVARLFSTDDSGRLTFCSFAGSLEPATVLDLQSHPVLFGEIVLEAPVRYALEICRNLASVVLTVSLFGGSRDAHLPGWIPWAIRRSGVAVDAADSHGQDT